jgi:hypothetical protein
VVVLLAVAARPLSYDHRVVSSDLWGVIGLHFSQKILGWLMELDLAVTRVVNGCRDPAGG